MHRWIARLLLLVTLFPAVAPLALADTAPMGMQCMRRPMHQGAQIQLAHGLQKQTAQHTQPAMHCHHGMAQAPQTEPSVRADGCCCCHGGSCCCCLKTSEWARPARIQLSFVSLQVEQASAAPARIQASADLTAPDSARAPPRT